MIYKYEMACKEAGLSEEHTAQIRKVFRKDKEKLRYDKRMRKEQGITFSYVVPSESESEVSGDLESRDIVDENSDVEEKTMHKLLLEQLNQYMKELSVEDREFLLYVFDEYGGAAR